MEGLPPTLCAELTDFLPPPASRGTKTRSVKEAILEAICSTLLRCSLEILRVKRLAALWVSNESTSCNVSLLDSNPTCTTKPSTLPCINQIEPEESLLLALPPELLYHIYNFLRVQDFVFLRSTCKQLYYAGDDEYLWKRFCLRDFAPIRNDLAFHFGKTWKFLYRSKMEFKDQSRETIKDGAVGCLVTKEGRYEGEWIGGELHGYGFLVSAAGNIIEGQWKKGMGHGFGSVRYVNGDKYAGQWTNGEVTGKGICFFAEGTVYKGEWKANAVNGKGLCTFADGSHYEGNWKAGKREGKGLFVWKNGASFEGTWKMNQASGVGVHICKDRVTTSKMTFMQACACCGEEATDQPAVEKTQAEQESRPASK